MAVRVNDLLSDSDKSDKREEIGMAGREYALNYCFANVKNELENLFYIEGRFK